MNTQSINGGKGSGCYTLIRLDYDWKTGIYVRSRDALFSGWSTPDLFISAKKGIHAHCSIPLEGPRRNMREIFVKPFSLNHIELDTVTNCIDMILLVKRVRAE